MNRPVPIIEDILISPIQTNNCILSFLPAAGLAQSVERLTAEREVTGLIPGAGPILRVLKITKK